MPEDAVAGDHRRGEHGVACQRRGLGPRRRTISVTISADLDDGDRDRQHQRAERLADAVCDRPRRGGRRRAPTPARNRPTTTSTTTGGFLTPTSAPGSPAPRAATRSRASSRWGVASRAWANERAIPRDLLLVRACDDRRRRREGVLHGDPRLEQADRDGGLAAVDLAQDRGAARPA